MGAGVLEQQKTQDLSYNNFPRTVDSLCPECIKPIKAVISIKGKNIVMDKDCLEHGHFSEVLSDDKDFFLRMEKLSFGDGPGIANPCTTKIQGCPHDCGLCTEHKSTTMMGVIDLTNRCNLKCPICYANSNAAGYIYEPSYEQIVKMMLNLYNVKPVHAPCIQFLGGEPTLHPQFLDIISEAKKIGFTQIQVATNGITIANSLDFAKKASEAGLNFLYLQFDGVSDDVYLKIRGKSLLEIKKKAIENARKAGLRVVLVPTLAKNYNANQIGDIIKFAIDNLDVVSTVAFQPIALTGRITNLEKNNLRFTITDLVREVEKQFPQVKMLDWYPFSFLSPFSKVFELFLGQPKPRMTCHSHCGIATALVINKEKTQIIPLPRFMDVVGIMTRMEEIYNEAQKKIFFRTLRSQANFSSYLKELEAFYFQDKAPGKLPLKELLSFFKSFANPKLFSNNQLKREELKKRGYSILLLTVMHFQDAYNYEAERSKRCVVHYAAPNGKMYPFCTYNCGPCFRTQVEKQFVKSLK